MQELKTRSARHQKSKRTLVINKKAIAPLVGTTLLVGPMMVTAAPQHVRADEQAPQNTTDPQAFINQINAVSVVICVTIEWSGLIKKMLI